MVQLPDFDTTSDFTLSMFVKPDTAGNMSFVSKADAAGVNQLWTGQWDGKFDIKLNSTPDVVGGQATSNYQHVLFTVRKINGTQSELKLYKDKVAVVTSTVNTVFSNNTGKGWTIDQDFDGEALSDYFKGVIDEVSFYKGVLSTEEINSVYSNSSNIIVKNYDTIGRINTSVINNNYTTSYYYKDVVTGIGSTTNVISKITNKNSSIDYTYDKNGNVETVNDNSKLIKYTYNELNEVIREDNAVLSKTIVYSYDIGGNILSKIEYPYTTGALGTATSTMGYTYDGTWKDKLASYNGKAITYDAIGNPLTYNGNTYTWEIGRRLKTISGNGNTISYKYNDSGIRTEKTVNGVTTKYSLVGDKVTFENNGSEKLYYTYDSNGKLLSMNVTSPTNIFEGSSDIGMMDQSPNNAGVTISEFTNPKTNNKVKAIRLNKDASIPNIWSPYIGLKTNTNYVLEFDYWADADDVKFDVDLFPDDLPQSFPIAKKTVQRYKWEFSSPLVSMTATMLRFFNDTVQVYR